MRQQGRKGRGKIGIRLSFVRTDRGHTRQAQEKEDRGSPQSRREGESGVDVGGRVIKVRVDRGKKG